VAREVSVRITANTSGFNSGMDQAGSKAAQTAAKIKSSFDSGLSGISKNSRSINALSSGLGKVGIVAAVGVGAAVKAAAQFDSAMSLVAATGADARANLGALREAAIKAGADTKYSASEAAGGLEALAKAGVSSKDALGGGLAGALNLAAAGNLGVADSAEVAASALNQFGLSGAEVPHIADLLAQAAGTAQGEVSDMAAALNQSGLVANQFGLSIDETAQSLALFAKNGLVGSDAGTSFKTMLTSLYAPAGTGAKALDQLGVSAYDAQGAIKPIGEVTDELKGKLDSLSEQDRNSALKNIFGSDALRAGTILLKDGSAGLSNMATEFGKFGSAADVARTKMDNLQGDLEQLKGSFETALIGLGEGGQGPLRSLAQNLTGAVNGFNKLGDGTKSAILAVAGIGAASALGVAGVGKLAIGAAEAYSAFGKLSTNLPRLAGAMRGLGIAAGIAVGAFIALRAAGAGINALMGDNAKSTQDAALAVANLGQNAAQGSSSLDSFFAFTTKGDITVGAQSIDSMSEAFARLNQGSGGITKFNDGLTGLTSNLTGVKGSAEIITDRFSQLDERLSALAVTSAPEAAKGFQQIAAAAASQGVPLDKLVALFPQYASAVRSASDANGGTISSTQQLVDIMSSGLPSGVQSTSSALDSAGAALDKIGSSSSGAEADLNALNTALFATANAALATSNAQIGFEAAVDAAAASAKKNGDNLKTSTAAGRENKAALNQLAAASQGYVQSLIDQDASVGKVKAATADARGEFIKQAQAMGISKNAAKGLADDYGLIPKNVTTNVETKTGNAKAELGKVNAAIKGLPKSQQVEVRSAYKSGGIEAAKKKIAELKDKTVTATAKGNSQGATKVDRAMKDLDSKTVTATAKGNPKGARDVKSAVDSVKGKKVTVSASASGIGAVYELRSAIATVKGKTVTVTVKRSGGLRGSSSGGATGGMITPAGFIERGPLRRSTGGPVYGAGTATSDSIPALLSNGEFVINAKSVRTIGADRIAYMNRKGEMPKYALGGPVGLASGGRVKAPTTVGLTTDREILRAVTAQFHVDQAKNLNERRKADQELAKAMKKLNDTQTAALDSIKSLSTSLQEPYRSKSTDVTDVLTSMQDGAKDLTAFGAQIKQLKALGLDQAVIDQITADGAINGGELASQIIDGGAALVKSLNTANEALVKAGTVLGETSTGLASSASKPKKKHAAGGYISGPGTGTSDSISALLSNGEFVVNSEATARNRSVLEAINYGRARINEHRFMPAYAGGGSSVQQVDRSFHEGSMVLQYQGDLERGIRLAQAAKRDNLTMARLTGAV
jgi:TP901 family phage tail tape measure protein